jgi:hypothetical protein
VPLVQDEPEQPDDRDHEPGDDQRVGPPTLGALDDREQQAAEPDDRQEAPERIERGALALLRSRCQDRARHERDDGDRRGHEEHRAVPEVLEQEAAHQRTDRTTGPGEAGPDGDRLGPFARRKRRLQQAERRRHDERGADAHERSHRDQ